MKHDSTWSTEQIILPISGTVQLSFVKGLTGPDSFEAGLIYHGKVVDVCPCRWVDMFEIYDAVKNGIFSHFTSFHDYMMGKY
jgi:hypothetical protein